ncbi:MAG: hypothetical protein E7F47_01870 [Peptoniphilus harei]|nr:hypothetical protein [Peptoniphilus harei]
MKIKELIQELEKKDGDEEILASTYFGDYEEIFKVTEIDDGTDGTYLILEIEG